MKTYDYLENVKEDVRNYIEENKIVVTSSNREEVEQELNDTLFVNYSHIFFMWYGILRK